MKRKSREHLQRWANNCMVQLISLRNEDGDSNLIFIGWGSKDVNNPKRAVGRSCSVKDGRGGNPFLRHDHLSETSKEGIVVLLVAANGQSSWKHMVDNIDLEACSALHKVDGSEGLKDVDKGVTPTKGFQRARLIEVNG